MSHPQPTPQDDDQTPIVHAVMNTLDLHVHHDIDCCDVQAILDALKTLGYELVSQVGSMNHRRALLGPYEPTTHFYPAPAHIESIAQWLGERESTHLWPEIHESDKACYRDAARHLVATVGGVGEFGPQGDDQSAAEVIESSILEELDLGGDAKSCTNAALDALKSAGWSIVAGDEGLVRLVAEIGEHRTGTMVAVELPEPDSTSDGGRYVAGWDVLGEHDAVRVDCFGHIEDADGAVYTPNEAREYVAALLAAAAKVEAGE